MSKISKKVVKIRKIKYNFSAVFFRVRREKRVAGKREKQQKVKRTSNVPFFTSIRMKIVALTVFAVVLTAVISMSTVPFMRESLTNVTKNYMKDVAVLSSDKIDSQIKIIGGSNALAPKVLANALGGVSVEGIESSYAYVVSNKGTYLYHPSEDLIGQPVDTAAVLDVATQLEAGTMPEPAVFTYEEDGSSKYAAYSVGVSGAFFVVVTANEAEVNEPITEVVSRCVIGVVGAIIVCLIISLVMARAIVKPIGILASIVDKLKTLDLREDDRMAKIGKRKDEVGLIARAIDTLQDQLLEIINVIKSQAESLYGASADVSTMAEETSQTIVQVEKAVNEVATGATSQARETQSATENVIIMGNMVEETNHEVENLRSNARIMRDAGEEALSTLHVLTEVNKQTKEAIEAIAVQTEKTNESAMEIRKATELITDIADETSLLSLNATLEAARAGEQGRGFAVVASQIQKLSEQSNEAARQIAKVIDLLIAESDKSVETMKQVAEIVEKQNGDVMKTADAFNGVQDGIAKSIEGIREIATRTENLDAARVKVVDIVQTLTAIAEENAATTEQTSASVTEVGAISSNVADSASHMTEIANELDTTIGKFTL